MDLMQISRRRAMQLSAAGAVVAAVTRAAPAGATRDRGAWRIDTHHHVVPKPVRDWLIDLGVLPPHGGPRWAQWDLATTVDAMAENDMATGVASMPAPSMLFADKTTARYGVRLMNESVAELVKDHPRRFGHFAYVSHQHVDLALDQIAYAFDELDADGVLLMNSTDGRYLGDPAFTPILDELDRRRAVVFTHPDGLPGEQVELAGIENYVADFMLDTTRNALSLLQADALRRYPSLSVILSHGGGMLPYISARVERAARRGEGPDPEAVRHGLRHFYYDTAAPLTSTSSATLLAVADPRRILFGTDWSQITRLDLAGTVRGIECDHNLNPLLQRAIGRHNALQLLPNLARRAGQP